MPSEELRGIALPQDWELIGFFEAEPALSDPEDAWALNNYIGFHTECEDNAVECLISPLHGDLAINWSQHGREILSLTSSYARKIVLNSKDGVESMTVHYDEADVMRPLVLQLKPTVFVSWGSDLSD